MWKLNLLWIEFIKLYLSQTDLGPSLFDVITKMVGEAQIPGKPTIVNLKPSYHHKSEGASLPRRTSYCSGRGTTARIRCQSQLKRGNCGKKAREKTYPNTQWEERYTWGTLMNREAPRKEYEMKPGACGPSRRAKSIE